jgi:hypothetical protein
MPDRITGLFEFLGQFLHDRFRITQGQQNAGAAGDTLWGTSIPDQALQIGSVLFQQLNNRGTLSPHDGPPRGRTA